MGGKELTQPYFRVDFLSGADKTIPKRIYNTNNKRPWSETLRAFNGDPRSSILRLNCSN